MLALHDKWLLVPPIGLGKNNLSVFDSKVRLRQVFSADGTHSWSSLSQNYSINLAFYQAPRGKSPSAQDSQSQLTAL